LDKVYESLFTIFSLNYNEASKFIVEYFALTSEDWIVFERAVRMTKEYFVTGI